MTRRSIRARQEVRRKNSVENLIIYKIKDQVCVPPKQTKTSKRNQARSQLGRMIKSTKYELVNKTRQETLWWNMKLCRVWDRTDAPVPGVESRHLFYHIAVVDCVCVVVCRCRLLELPCKCQSWQCGWCVTVKYVLTSCCCQPKNWWFLPLYK